ncbi:hypothetical protein [Cohnella zeiphila]|uniref:Uncharacterized protein n=1 Tax=Cohnella zeiphila TaxID=2761120 RepID=A0A7X0SL33_9BACL|nr:hypothetical protein [Cohnella zeiphila]MBB6731891.1 hypothetical protein [Cohnella zeiphila]
MQKLHPFFNMDESAAASSGESYRDMFTRLDSADDVQPETDTDAEVEEESADLEDGGSDASESDDDPQEEDGTEEVEVEVEDEDPEISLGEGKASVKRSELIKGYLRQSDYTKKSQELATQRKEVEALSESLKPVKEWRDHMDANPWLWQQLNTAIARFNEEGVLPIEEVLQDSQYGKYVNHLLAENNRLKKENETIKGDYEGVKLTSEMSNLRTELQAEYGDLVTDDYMQQLQDRAKNEKLSTATLREIADGHLAKEKLKASDTSVKKATRQAEAKAVQKLAETRKRAPEAPTARATAPASKEPDRRGGWGNFFRSLSD